MVGRKWRVSQGVLVAGAVLALGSPVFAQDAPKPVTFTKDVAPIFQAKCQSCHQPNSIAPMSLIIVPGRTPLGSLDQGPREHAPDAAVAHRPERRRHRSSRTTCRSPRSRSRPSSAGWTAVPSQGDPKDMPPAKPLVTDNEWTAVKDGFGPPDLVISSPEYVMPAQHQDMWWRPMSDIPVTEPRWVRMVEIRPTNLKARKIVHHAIAYHVLSPDNTGEVNTGIGSFGNAAADDLVNRRPQLMEWAIGKGYDRFREGTGKLVVPGEKISWDQHIHAVGEEIKGGTEIGLWFYPKGQEPTKHSYLVAFIGHQARRAGPGGPGHPAELDRAHGRLHGAEGKHDHHQLPAALPPARQGHAG